MDLEWCNEYTALIPKPSNTPSTKQIQSLVTMMNTSSPSKPSSSSLPIRQSSSPTPSLHITSQFPSANTSDKPATSLAVPFDRRKLSQCIMFDVFAFRALDVYALVIYISSEENKLVSI